MRLVIDIGKKFPDITGPMSDAFTAELKTIAEHGDFHELVLDFKDLRSINSLAMGAIFEVHHELQQKGKSLLIVNASEKIARLLQMVNLADIVV